MMKRIISALFALLAISAQAEIKLPAFFSDGMVLQQQTECRIWGTAEKNVNVSVTTSWDNQTYQAKAANDGAFEVSVHTPEAGGPFTITLSENNRHHTLLTLQTYIGEVWLCSGQSNMEMQMKGYKAQPVEGATEVLLDCADPMLHFFTVKRLASLTPQDDVEGTWSEATTASVREFSATAYFFGRALRRQLGVPVGLICTAFGGSACEAWMKADWLKAFPKVQQTITEDDVKKLQQRCPTALFNGQLAPLIGYGIRGAIWYQGEDNVPRYDYYAPLLSRMIQGWRTEWQQGDFPFYYCQIAPFDYSVTDWALYNSALLREQQAMVEQSVSNCRMAVLLDVGLKDVIHPRKKRIAGERLALLALNNTYGVKGLPEFAGSYSDNFEIAGADKVFHPAKAWVNRNRVYVTSSSVKQPVAVRYAFHDWVIGDLMHDGLPVSSFRTDEW